MKKTVMVGLIGCMFVFTGCRTTGYSEKSFDKDGNVSHSATFYAWNLISMTSFSSAEVDYNGIKFKLSNFSGKGDVEMMDSISKMVIYAVAAYASMGTTISTETIFQALKSGEVDKVISKINSGEKVSISDFPVAVSFGQRKIKK